MFGIIYLAKNKVNKKIYIGQTTKGLHERKLAHRRDAKNNNGNNCRYFSRAINKYGLDGFVWEEIATATSLEELNFLEKKFILELNCRDRSHGYNIAEGGGNGPLSKETKERISKSIKDLDKKDNKRIIKIRNKLKEFYGNEENKLKASKRIRKMMKNKKTLNKIIDWSKRRWKDEKYTSKMTEIYKSIEHGVKISRAQGIKPFYAKRDEKVMTFNTIKEASIKLNVAAQSIGKVLLGKRKTAGGWFFSYENIENIIDNRIFYMSKDSEVVKFFSKASAARHIGSKASDICQLLKGVGKSLKGWKIYIPEVLINA